jgi:hypothetical protein
MTKPANFPGRVNDRRLRALERIERQLASGTKCNSGVKYPLTAEDASRLTREANALGLNIVPEVRARAVRTKKTKALGWSAARAAYRSGRLSA